jgi:hypothetical protein
MKNFLFQHLQFVFGYGDPDHPINLFNDATVLTLPR